ncbi:MAG: glycoside hydrolase family 97 protein [Hyphomonadaceae bacterium]|nr:MAG: alpha-glucosidase [Caulobacteraceae bacterium]MBT9445792.1 glycoside hydrolase family 97 protein [Hyphomonadaceae bacterium]
MKNFVRLAVAITLPFLLAMAAHAAPVAEVASPDGAVRVEIAINDEGRASYAASYRGEAVIAPSRLGFLFVDAPKLERNLTLTSRSVRSFDENWQQPWGEQRQVRNHYNEMRFTLTERTGPGRSFDVVFRVYDDGLGFRYEFPDTRRFHDVRILNELTEFNFARAGEAIWTPALGSNREEYLYHRTPLEQIGTAQTPLTARLDNGVHLSIHEAALVDYSGMNLMRIEGRGLRATLTPGPGDAAVTRTAPFHTPWRTIQISPSAGGLVESRLILNLNEPNALGDVSWFRPGKYVGIWWQMHLGTASWASGPKHGATTENALRYIDFAGRHGFRGVLIEGWNIGWDGDWFGNGEEFSFTTPYPDFDLERIAAHARARGVQLIGHHETSANAAHYEDQMEAAFTLSERLGVHIIKTGYVSDAGQARVHAPDGSVRYAWHEGQDMARHHLRVVQAAASHRIAINPHEPIKDTGLRRTWPNWVAREGARGMEYNAWGNPSNPPEHEVNLVFTRLLAGPMDFTPGIFGMDTPSPQGVATTWAKQLALYVAIYSPIQMAADLLENYEANPGPFQFIRDVPTDWEETRVLNGEIGDFVTIVRRDRNSRDWYLGAITDENARVLTAPLSFLQRGVRYRAQIYRDGPGADYRGGARSRIVIEERVVTAGDTLTLALAPGGGQAIRFHPLR